MSDVRCHPTQADPASQEPSAGRPEHCASCGGETAADRTDRYIALLDELTDLGMALARELVADAREEIALRRAARAAAASAAASPKSSDGPAGAPGPETPAGAAADPLAAQLDPAVDPAIDPEPDPERAAWQRAARDPAGLAFHRLTRALRLCMALSLKLQRDRAEGAAKETAERAAAEQERKPRLRKQLKRLVTEAVKRRDRSDTRQEFDLLGKLRERVEEDDIERDLTRCPVSELIARICKDLGIKPAWDLWEAEHWAEEEARAGTPGSPYAKAAPAETPKAETPEPAPAEPPAQQPNEPKPDEPKLADLKPAEAEPPDRPPPDIPPPERPPPEPDPREAAMKARLAAALRSGSWVHVLQTDQMLAAYARSKLNSL